MWILSIFHKIGVFSSNKVVLLTTDVVIEGELH